MTALEYETQTNILINETLQLDAQSKHTQVGYFWAYIKTIESPAFLKESWNKLVSLNPVLKEIKMDTMRTEDLYNAHMGVTSGFNVDDINFYLEKDHNGGKPALQARNMPSHGDLLERIESVSATPIHWVPSPATAQKIEKRFKRRGLL